MAGMVRMLALGGAAILLLGAVLAAWSPPRDPSWAELDLLNQQAQATATALAVQQAATVADAARWEAQKAALMPWWTGLLILFTGGTGVLAVTLAGLGALRLVQQVRPLVSLSLDGQTVLVDRRALHGGAWAALPDTVLGAGVARAQAFGPQVPHSYSPHTVYQNRQEGQLPAPPTEPPLLAIPTFDALLDQGLIGAGRPLLLGYAGGDPLTGTWRDLYSSAVAGLSGSGKTTALRFLTGQSALHGARFLLLDPHAEAGDESLAGTLAPLASVFLAPPAADPKMMLALLDTAQGVMHARLTGQQPAAWPLIVAVDEWTALMGRSDLADPLAALVESIAQEGRKVACFALISGQIFTAARAGGTALRDALASAYICRMKREQARLLISADDARRAPLLRPGQALLARATGEVLDIGIPNTTAAHMARVGALLATNVATAPATKIIDLATYQATAIPPQTQATTPSVSLEAKRALTLFRQHKSMARVVETMYGITSDKGRLYQSKLTEVSAMVADAIEGLEPA